MIAELVALFIFWINALPPSPYVEGDLRLIQIVTGITIDYTKHHHLQFGEYAQVHEYNKNTMQERSTGAIALRPTGNAQWAYFFMSLVTGRRLNQQNFTPLHFPQDIINSVHHLERRNPRGLNIWDRDRWPFLEAEDGANDKTYDPTHTSSNREDNENGDERDDNNKNIKPYPN